MNTEKTEPKKSNQSELNPQPLELEEDEKYQERGAGLPMDLSLGLILERRFGDLNQTTQDFLEEVI